MLYRIGRILCIVLLSCFFISSVETSASCYRHYVSEGETLGDIAISYFGDIRYWPEIAINNGIIADYALKANEPIHIYSPSADWADGCMAILTSRLLTLRHPTGFEFLIDIPCAIEQASEEFLHLEPLEKLEVCRQAIATVEQESMYRFAVGSAGEIGPYQFKLATARYTLQSYGLDSRLSDKELVLQLMDNHFSTYLFVLHFAQLKRRCNNSLACAWYYYNNGDEASAYSAGVLKRYRKIRWISPMPECRSYSTGGEPSYDSQSHWPTSSGEDQLRMLVCSQKSYVAASSNRRIQTASR